MPLQVPKYRELPIQNGAPDGSAWGVFDKDGKRDVYGTLNFITPDRVVDAKAEIQTGQSVVLNLPLHLPHNGVKVRIKTQHTLVTMVYGMHVIEDELTLNTQSSSQWDGLTHFAHQERQEFYNGVKYADVADAKNNKTLGIQSLSERGGVVGRGVLLDFVRYADLNGLHYDPMTNYAISLDQLKDMVKEEKLELRPGDILLVRCGISRWIRSASPDEEGPLGGFTHIGVDPTPELFEWLWDHNLAAVGGDAMAFEACPAPDGSRMRLHTACLPGWGMMIGELLDLEALAAVAEKNQRWSFFLTISPLNLEGGAATLSNTVAVF